MKQDEKFNWLLETAGFLAIVALLSVGGLLIYGYGDVVTNYLKGGC